MSFSSVREYSRPLLGPLGLTCDAQPPSINDSRSLPGVALRQAPTTSSSWTATTHTFIGAGRRVSPLAWPPARFSEDPASIPDDAKHNVHYQTESAQKHSAGSAGATYRVFDEQELAKDGIPPPRLVTKRYIPNRQASKSTDQITLLMLTGMGLPKEMFEPMIEALLADTSLNIAEIWAVDMPLSGETALVNPIGYLYGNEKDIARDLLSFVTSYLPLSAGQSLPAELAPRSFDVSSASHSTRPNLHVIAHSLGAQSAMLIAAHAPNLFASLSVFDPAMIPDGKIRKAFTAMPKDVLCTGIRQSSESRAALAAEIDSNKRTRGWDARVKKIFVDRGAVEDGKGNVRLVAHPRLEWALYYDQETPTHCYDRLTDITVPLNAIMPARPFAVPPAMLEADIAKLKQKTRLTWIPKTTHQLPFERVDDCAKLVIAWLKDLVPSAKL